MKKLNDITILQSGFPKSGNYWLWKILNQILITKYGFSSSYISKTDIYNKIDKTKLANIDQHNIDVIDADFTGVYFRVGPDYKEKIDDFNLYITQSNHIWTHSHYNKRFYKLLNGNLKVVYVIRNPLNVLKSHANFAFTPYILNRNLHNYKDPESYLNERFEFSIRKWVLHVSGWLSQKNENMHIILYENLQNDISGEIAKLGVFLGVDLTNQDIKKIIDATSQKVMSEQSPMHVNKFKNKLIINNENYKKFSLIAGDLIDAIGYDKVSDKKVIDLSVSKISIDRLKKINHKVKYSPLQIIKGIIYLGYGKLPIKQKIKTIIRQLKDNFF